MPTYGYKCMKCGDVWELNRPMANSGDPVPCVKCNTERQRVFNAPQIITSRWADKPENKYAGQSSNAEMVQMLKADDKRQEAQFNGLSKQRVADLKKTEKLKDVFKKEFGRVG